MFGHHSRLSTVLPAVLAAFTSLAGCGGDSNDSKANGAEGEAGSEAQSDGTGTSGSKAAKGDSGAAGSTAVAAGKGGTAGKASAAGKGGAAGAAPSGDAGKGGSESPAAEGGKGGSPAGAGGSPAAGSGGASGSAAPLPDLSNATGTVIADVNALSGVTYAADGKIYASGDINVIDASNATGATEADKYKASVTGHKVAVYRFLADGTPDKSFGSAGRTVWEGPDGEATSMGLAETDDGSVVVDVNLRQTSKRVGVALVKFDKTGKLVTTFGKGGRVDLVFGWTDADLADYPKDAMGAVRYPADQSWNIRSSDAGTKLVVFASGPALHGLMDTSVTPAVQRVDNDRYIVRVLSSDGTIDPSFNGGKFSVNTPNDGATGDQGRFPSDGGRHGLVESDGSIVSAGYTNYNDGKGNQITLIRLKPDGSFDASFHKERAGQPLLPGVAVFNPVPEDDKGFAECYGVAHTTKGYVTTGYGMAYVGMSAASSLGYLPSKSVDMISTRFTGTAVDTTFGRSGVFAAQSELLGDNKVSTFEDRGRSAVIALADDRAVMGGRFGQYPALFVLTDAGKLDAKIKGKQTETNGMLLFPTLTSSKQPATSSALSYVSRT